jgi:hypothetical protein
MPNTLDRNSKSNNISSSNSSSSKDNVSYHPELPTALAVVRSPSKIPTRVRRPPMIHQDELLNCVCGCGKMFPNKDLVSCKVCNEYVSKSCCSTWRCNKINCNLKLN